MYIKSYIFILYFFVNVVFCERCIYGNNPPQIWLKSLDERPIDIELYGPAAQRRGRGHKHGSLCRAVVEDDDLHPNINDHRGVFSSLPIPIDWPEII